jgi:hypothetical protein
VGVDTGPRNHVYAILASISGELLETRAFQLMRQESIGAIKWVAKRTGADADTLWVIE